MVVDDLERLSGVYAILVHILNDGVAFLSQSICQVLIDIHGYINLFMSQPPLYILQGRTVFYQHGCVRMSQTMEIELWQVKLFMDNLCCVLHRSQIDVFPVLPSANKVHLFVYWIFCDSLAGIFIIMPVSLSKIRSRPHLSVPFSP